MRAGEYRRLERRVRMVERRGGTIASRGRNAECEPDNVGTKAIVEEILGDGTGDEER